MNVAVQEDLRDKVSEVVRRLTADARQGELTARLTSHTLQFQHAALPDDGTPHFMCEAGSILQNKECGKFLLLSLVIFLHQICW